MILCKTCGSANDDKAELCSGCSAPLKGKAAASDSDLDLDSLLDQLKTDEPAAKGGGAKKPAAKGASKDADLDLNLDDDQIFKELGISADSKSKGKAAAANQDQDIFADLSGAKPKDAKGKPADGDDIFAELGSAADSKKPAAKKPDAKKSDDDIFADLDLELSGGSGAKKPEAKPAAKPAAASAKKEEAFDLGEFDGLEIMEANDIDNIMANKQKEKKAESHAKAEAKKEKPVLGDDEIDLDMDLLGLDSPAPLAGISSKPEAKPAAKAEAKPAAKPAAKKDDDDIFSDLGKDLKLDVNESKIGRAHV